MKKLMIVAAVAAMGVGAFADDNPQLWDVKINLKAFQDNWIKCGDAGSDGCVTCELNEWGESGSWYAETETRKIEAILVNCNPCGLTFDDAENATNIAFFAWDKTHEVALTKKAKAGKSAGWAITNGCALAEYGEDGAPAAFKVFLYGKKINKAGVALQFMDGYDYGYALQCFGLGSWDLSKDRLKSASGNVIGMAPIQCDKSLPKKAGYAGETYTLSHLYMPGSVCDAASYCTDFGEGDWTDATPVYGSFTIKYNASKARNYFRALPDGMIVD